MAGSTAERRRGVRTLVLGMLTAQVAAIVATPLLTRLYDPAAFGSYAFLLSLVAVGAPVAALRFDAAIVLPDDRSEAWQLVRTGAAAALVLAVILAAVVWIVQPNLLAYELLDSAVVSLLPWLPPLLLAAGIFQLCSAWHIRERMHVSAARGRAAQGLLTATAQVVLGFVTTIPAGLVLGDLLGRMGAVLSLLRGTFKSAAPSSASASRQAASLMRRYRGFATFSSTTALVNALNSALPVLIVGTTLGLQATGLLLLAQRIASLPVSLLVSAVSQVFAVDLARAEDADARVSLYWSTIGQLMRYALPAFGIIVVLSPFYGLIFGDQWQYAGVVAAALVPFYGAQLFSGATIIAVEIMQAHRARLVRELIYLVGMLVVLITSTRASASLGQIAIAISSFGVVFYVISIRWAGRCLRHERLS
jgi:O-antigen/teichoic acid export membrane protein